MFNHTSIFCAPALFSQFPAAFRTGKGVHAIFIYSLHTFLLETIIIVNKETVTAFHTVITDLNIRSVLLI